MATPILRSQQLARHLSKMGGAAILPAPWRADFLSHVDDMESPNFVLSTLHGEDTSSPSAPAMTPRARTVVFRGMWASLPPNSRNTAPRNPQSYETDMLAITTDARMEKVSELFGDVKDSDSMPQSQVGGIVEGVLWSPKPMTQWRIRGHVCLIGPDIDSDDAATVRQALNGYMRRTGEEDSWSWSRELTAHFGNLSPGMRGTFRNPPSGAPISQKPDEGLSLGQKVDNLDDPIARKHFRVLLVVPEEVDRVDLTDPSRGRRWNYKLSGPEGDGKWKTTELWP